MKLSKCFILRFLSVLLFSQAALAIGGVVRIPLNTFINPAKDIKRNGQEITTSIAAQMFQQDPEALSTINPVENKYWQNQKYSAVDLTLHAKMPQAETGVQITNEGSGNRELGFFTVNVKTANDERYTLTLGQQVHASLFKAALLRKLGHYQESPKYYSKMKINFSTVAEKEKFINSAFCENGPSEESIDCLSLSPFKTASNKKEYLSHAGKLGLYVHGVYLEKMNPEVPGLFDGLAPATEDTLPHLRQTRAFRSLIVPFAIGDIKESVEGLSTQSVTLTPGYVNINYGFDYYFDTFTDESDAKWSLRRMGELTDKDWDEIIEASQYPRSIRQLVKAKVLYRFKNMVDSFFKKSDRGRIFKVQIPDINYSSSDGIVVNGHITTDNISGYPQRFAYGERQSPFESGDFLRYMKVKTVSSAIGVALNQLQEKIRTNNTLTLNQHIDGFLVSRNGVRTIGHVTGLNLGVNYGASRQLTTGTFYGSTAPIQLVDNTTISAGIGLMHTINELHGFGIGFGANVSYNRDFTHVRPVTSIKEGSKIDAKTLDMLKGEFVLRKIGQFLEDGKLENKDGATNGFVNFISELKEGEVFLITDSISAGAQVGVNVGLDNIVGFYAGPFSPSVGLTASGTKVLLRQIQIMKTPDGLQVFVRNQNSKAFSLSFDVNYFINLMKIKAETTRTKLHTDAFILNYNQALVEKGDKGEVVDEDTQAEFERQKAFGNKVAGALRGLIFQSSADQLYANFRFQQFQIDHKLKTDVIKKKILWYRSTKLQEEHLIKVYKPLINNPESGAVENVPVEIAAYRKGELRGSDKLGFAMEGVDGLTSYYFGAYAPTLSESISNPANVPFGKAEWRIVKTEADMNPTRFDALPTVSSIQHIWGGWSISHDKIEALIQSASERIKGSEYEGQELVPAHILHNIKKLDFFRITSNLHLLPGALNKVKAMVISPDTEGIAIEKQPKMDRFFRWLFHKKNPARVEDKAIYNNILEVIGDGDMGKGRELYLSECRENQGQNYQYTWMKGTSYECLEPWVEKVIKKSRDYAQAKTIPDRNKWMTEILFVLEEKIPLGSLLKYIEKPNYAFYIEVNGFRSGDENAYDGTIISNVLGEASKDLAFKNGLMSRISEKSKVISTEIDRMQADFQ